MHVWFDQGITAFRFTVRVGGQSYWPRRRGAAERKLHRYANHHAELDEDLSLNARRGRA
ncbi:MAG: hypothetical protein Q8K32_07000 [Archangium sp.]|nr:hypothetical protein [Archangium sp.]